MAGNDLEHQLVDDGTKLLNPPFSIDELLSILESVEVSLLQVRQSTCGSVAAALSPLRNALVSNNLLRHSDTDVKVSVAFCISQIIRITAPDPPYNDAQMKEIFHLIVAVFQKLSHKSSYCYQKVVSVLVTIATTKAILVLLDIDCHALIIEMFQLFLKTTRSNNSNVVFSAMAAIMILAIWESENISLDILSPLLASVRKENQNVSPTSWMLGREVIKNCAKKIEPYLLKAVHSLGVSVDNYDQIVGSICQNATDNPNFFDIHGSEGHFISDKGIQSLNGKKTLCKTTRKNDGFGEADDKGQSLDFLSSGSSVKPCMQQLAHFTKMCSDQSADVQSLQKRAQENQGIKIPFSEDTIQAKNEAANVCCGMMFVQGYEVKASIAPILTAIFAKYGDIAANCDYKSVSVRASLLEIACNIVRRLKSADTLTLSEIKVIQNEVKDLEATQLNLSWLSQPLAKIYEVEKIAQMRSVLKSVKANSILVIKAVTRELEEALMELVASQKRMGQAEKRRTVMKLVVQKIDNTIKDAEAEERLWRRQMSQLL